MKKFKIYVTLPVYFYAEVEAENAEKALDEFDFADAQECAEYKLRYATYIETQELDDNGEVVDVVTHEDE